MLLKRKDEAMNEILNAIKDRRSVMRFESTGIEDDKLEAILEAGRWAPSWINKKPWNFIVLKKQKNKEKHTKTKRKKKKPQPYRLDMRRTSRRKRTENRSNI